jgi:hypothetical protein
MALCGTVCMTNLRRKSGKISLAATLWSSTAPKMKPKIEFLGRLSHQRDNRGLAVLPALAQRVRLPTHLQRGVRPSSPASVTRKASIADKRETRFPEIRIFYVPSRHRLRLAKLNDAQSYHALTPSLGREYACYIRGHPRNCVHNWGNRP